MAKVEIKKATKSAIKTIENAGIITEKAKDVTVKTKDDIGKVINDKSGSPQEYAAQRVTDVAHTATDDAIYLYNKAGYSSTKKVVKEAPMTIEQIRQRRFELAKKKQAKMKATDDVAPKPPSTPKDAEKPKPIKTKNTKPAIKTKGTVTKQTERGIKKVNASGIKQVIKSNPKLNRISTNKFAKASIKSAEKVGNGIAKGAKAIKAIIAFLKKILHLARKAISSLVTAAISGGWVALIIIIILAIAGGLASSSYGIFLSNEESETGITMKSVVQELNVEFQEKLEAEKSSHNFDDIDIVGTQADWRDVLGVYAIKTNTDSVDPQEIATIDDSKKQLLKSVFWDMNKISSATKTVIETVEQTELDEEGNEITKNVDVEKTILVITISTKTANDMITEYSFSSEQKEQLLDLIADKNIQLWNALIYGTGALTSIDISSLDFSSEVANEQQKKVCVVATNSTSYGIVADSGYCQAWVADIYQVAVGNRGYAASAIAAGRMWSVSKDWSKIQVGATVYGYASNPFGHVGIYVGNGQVIHNLSGTITVQSLDSWVTQFKGACWGWENGQNLSGDAQYNCFGGMI